MIDLHLHTTISDGRLTPAELVERVASAGVRVMAVTDHDTTAGTNTVQALAATRGIEAVSGIEVTAVEAQKDIHILGYFVRQDDEALTTFLTEQRLRRIDRVRAISARLADLGVPVEVEALIAEASRNSGKSVGRPLIAAAMIRAGHVATIAEAFDRYLAHGQPGFVPREGPSCEQVIELIHAAGGLASLAHPGKTGIDPRIPDLCAAGLDAIETFHSDHDEATRARYAALAAEQGVLVTGGSDFHGDPQQARAPGSTTLPEEAWERVLAAAGRHA